ncbi:hypothetical protein GLOIN_2v1472586 [Rhizophagus clarus]|uniref:Uncharacterized protein n=1 Tax=Rhizophagus clarus TaxID=94130 RepID=A0A8H3LCS1_9GLOM|nr:hypothetical protein GLOIN_2v1472586 [Rhizophagus clarus]
MDHMLENGVVQGNTEDPTDPNYNDSSQAITSIYQKAFSNKTKYAGPLVMGFDIPHISEKLLSDVHFRPLAFKIENLSIMVFSICVSKNPDWNYAMRKNIPLGYIIKDHEFHAWKALLRHAGCTKITPFKKEESEKFFFSFNFVHDQRSRLRQDTLIQLYNCGFLQTTPENHTKQFWNAFQDALDSNICGIDGKGRILSIIADTFSYETCYYAHINDPGGVQMEKLKITSQ